MKIFFTSDTHYNHKKIIEYSKRPFEGMKDMEDAMVERWNSVVSPDDLVWHLGDFAMGPDLREEVTRIRKRLNGRIYLCLGNHDRNKGFYEACGFDHVSRKFSGHIHGSAITDTGPLGRPYRVHISHHPPGKEVQDEHDICLHGHVHELWQFQKPNLINVGVDQWNFTPHTIDEMLAEIDQEEDVNYGLL